MNQMIPSLAVAMSAVVGSAAWAAPAIPYSNPAAVNILRRVDINGNLPLVSADAPERAYPYDPYRVIDAGIQPWRFDSHDATEAWRIELPEPVNMTSLDIRWRGDFFATAFTVKSSLTGFGSLTDLVAPVAGNANANVVLNFPSTSVKFLELTATGFSHPSFYILHEMQAHGPAPIIQGTGYNLFAQPGKLDTITPGMALNVVDAVGNAGDNDINSFVRGADTVAPNDNAFFVLPLVNSTRLMAASLGMFEDQAWTDVQVYLSNDAVYNYDGGTNTWPGMTWTQVFDFTGADFRGAHFTFTPQMAKFIRVDWPADSRAGAALTELQLFETYIPEPASLALLTLGGIALMRRKNV